MKRRVVTLALVWLSAGCVLQTQTVEGEQADAGPGGESGGSPFSYVDPVAKTDIYYNGGNVGIGTSAPAAMLEMSSAAKDAAQIHINQTNTVSGEEGGLVWQGYYSGTTTLFGAAAIKRINVEDNNASTNSQRLGFFVREPVVDGALVERMCVRESGNVGIGTTDPGAVLDVGHQGAGITVARFLDTVNNAGFRFTINDAADSLGYGAPFRHGIKVANAESLAFLTHDTDVPKLVIDTNGNVGIGTTTPTAPLHVEVPSGTAELHLESVGGLGGVVRFSGSGIERATVRADVVAGELRFEAGGDGVNSNSPTPKMVIAADGNVGIGTTSPAATLDVNGTARLAKYASQPFACDPSHDGTIALTSKYAICACNGGSSQWVSTATQAAPCPWM